MHIQYSSTDDENGIADGIHHTCHTLKAPAPGDYELQEILKELRFITDQVNSFFYLNQMHFCLGEIEIHSIHCISKTPFDTKFHQNQNFPYLSSTQKINNQSIINIQQNQTFPATER